MSMRQMPASPILAYCLVALLGPLSAPLRAADAAPRLEIHVTVDPRVELLSTVFRLAGNPEYNQGKVESYAADVDAHFAPFRDHPAVAMARRLAEEKGISFDAVMTMAVHVADARGLEERASFDDAGLTLFERWDAESARAFLKELRGFVRDTRFGEFFDAHRPLYGRLEQRMRALVAEELDVPWLEGFFGGTPGERFTVIVAPLNGGANYGPRFRTPDGTEDLFAIIGVWKKDADGSPIFDQEVVSTIVHEFSHSFVNPLVAHHREALERAGETVFAAVRPAMERQAYGNWKTVIDESLVRAVEIRYLAAHADAKAVAARVAEEKARSFLWIGEVSDLLAEYQSSRERYPSLETFLPRVVRLFENLSPRVDGLVKAYEDSRPRVVSMTPANGATGVDPELAAITVTFDRPMKRDRYSVMRWGENSAERFPKMVKVGFDETGTILRMEVELEPEKVYELSLNSPWGGVFESLDSVPLSPYPVRFETGPARKP